MNTYKHIELAVLNGSMTAPLNFVIFTEESSNVNPTTLDSEQSEKQRESV
ncbi:hypothetical protein [Colwellia psychrerythraea]|jgi:hypothetical protein|uniref:Uncharacterized protein n=1 Tax=Colwellia psychrerythraea (strain 34H / ATCC BAA-681) TaxID=167879 RepID=Q481V1_COLP3|nr:hypothetical protein [Colwellia psychrerythraea]AAZ25347.1 hypothetical protein CPS_2451 [Colwellia psychrerythraea 34H]